MARALIGGLIARGTPAADLRVGESSAVARERVAREFKVLVSADNETAIAGCAIVIVAVKPQEAKKVLDALAPQLQGTRPVLLSIGAGIRIASLNRFVGPSVPVVRAMPNRPATVGAGVTGLYAAPDVPAEQRELAAAVMSAAGGLVWVNQESDLDVVTALSGSGPAYFFLLAEFMMQAAIGEGLEPAAARQLAVGTLRGAGALAASSDGDLARLCQEVTSKGGTTEAALGAFATADFSGIVAGAMRAAIQRSRDLAAQVED